MPSWVLSGGAVDMDFANSRYYGGTLTGLLSTSRASTGYAETVAGTLTSFATNTPRITDKGLLVEEARTNVVLWNRDCTNAAWTKTDITAAKDQSGVGGTANAASSLTATGANGTCLQAITLASSARFQSVYAKRLTGTGTVEMTMDNGTTWTAIVLTASYQQLSIPTQTLANPTVGFRIVTSGDAIAVDMIQNENGAFKTSPIPTTTVALTRAADVITPAGAASTLLLATPVSVVALTTGMVASREASIVGTSGTGKSLFGASFSANNKASMSHPSGVIETANTATWTGSVKTGMSGDASGRSLVLANGTVATDATAYTAPATGLIGSRGSAYLAGYLSRLTLWNTRLADATLKALTA